MLTIETSKSLCRVVGL